MFYQYTQNNSGGDFVFDNERGLTHFVIIEAHSPEEANRIAESIGLYWNGCDDGRDCSCCGDRWNPMWGEEKGDRSPKIYSREVEEYLSSSGMHWMGNNPEVFVHYLNGKIAGYPEKRKNKKKKSTRKSVKKNSGRS